MSIFNFGESHLFESNVSHEYFMHIENIYNRKPFRTSDHMGYTIEMLLSTKKFSKSNRKQKSWSKTFTPWPPGRHATRYIIESRCFLQHFSQMLIRLTRPLEGNGSFIGCTNGLTVAFWYMSKNKFSALSAYLLNFWKICIQKGFPFLGLI